MLLRNRFVLIAAAALVLGSITSRAQDAGALLDLLVKKKLITDQEAEEVRGELTRDAAQTSGGKWKLSAPINEVELYGDMRVRYEQRQGTTPDVMPGTPGPNDTLKRSRERYRLRLGLRGTLMDDWFFGLRFETSTNPRSTNVTFGDDAGPFGKASDSIGVGQAYLGYSGFRDIRLTAGKMPNPLVTTLMVWDADINPEGLAEQWKHTYNLSFGGGSTTAAAESYSKDSKNAVAAVTAEPFKVKLDLFVNLAQFVYDDSNPENPLGARAVSGGRLVPNTDAWMFAWQIGAKFNFPNNMYFQVAPVLYNYGGAGDSFNTFYVGGQQGLSNTASMATNQIGINSLLVLEVPAEFGFKIGEIPFRIFGDFAVNFDADDRAAAAGHPDKGDQRYAYQIGAGIGQLKTKHDMQLQAFWQHTEQYSLDPNLVDSDFFDSRVNIEGVVVQGGYAISDAIIFNLSYGYGRRADKSLGTGGVGDIGINPMEKYQIFQADLNVKF
ncbi:MAG TPA: putative porin [Chthoniobacterales bacterium]|nr:putative porin [Chthoniobacterales bacterium]